MKNSYVDSSVIMGMTGDYKPDGSGFEGIEYMLCRPETEFFPDLSKVCLFLFFLFFFACSGFFIFFLLALSRVEGFFYCKRQSWKK